MATIPAWLKLMSFVMLIFIVLTGVSDWFCSVFMILMTVLTAVVELRCGALCCLMLRT